MHLPVDNEKRLLVSQAVQVVLEEQDEQPFMKELQVTHTAVPLSTYPASHGHWLVVRVLNELAGQLVQLLLSISHPAQV